jgi:phage terminase large subunit
MIDWGAVKIDDDDDQPVAASDSGPIEVPYLPRRHFRALHASTKRWQFMCCHRRAGKTVAIANHLIRAASLNGRRWPPPRYGYVGPSFEQAKDLVWAYLKQYTERIPGIRYLEGELACILPTGATIKLYGGAAAYERMRGMYFDGIALDEYPLLNPVVFSTVVRPCLADYHGWGIISGTSNGDDHFNQLRLRYEDDPRWDFHIIPLSATGEEALSAAEAIELTQDMSPEEYAREMECAFDAPTEGSYYGELLNKLAQQGRICAVPPDLAAPVITAWDLGIHDYCCIWFYQVAGREIHFIDYLQDKDKGLDYYAHELQTRALKGGYVYKAHCLPHDVEAREMTTGQSRRAFLMQHLDEPVITAPYASPEDGIAAARGLLGLSWFDQVKCRKGLAMLRGYRKNKMGRPVHGPEPYSHGADAYRTFATAFHLVGGLSAQGFGKGPLRRKIRGLV